jgi:hypothetical protein
MDGVMALIIAGGIFLLIGWFWFLAVAFRKNLLWGFGSLVVPIIGIAFLIKYWQEAWRPTVFSASGMIVLYQCEPYILH